MKFAEDQYLTSETDILQDEERKAKRGHVLAELKETEQIYVNELSTILTVNNIEHVQRTQLFTQTYVY